jgi:hypothetical protein
MELLAAFASGFVAIAALVTSTYNVYLQRQQVRAQVWPYLVLEADYGTDHVLSLHVINRGVGPAKVERIRVTVDGKRAADWAEAEAMLLRVNSLSESWHIAPIEDEVMSPGLDITALEARRHGREMVAERRRLGIAICYCSSLDDCWQLDSSNPFEASTTQPVGVCVPDAKPFRSAGSVLDNMVGDSSGDAGKSADGGPGERSEGDSADSGPTPPQP